MAPDPHLPRYQPDPQTLYNRAREAGAENRKLLVSLSTGSLAFLFVGLTQQPEQHLTVFQKTIICFGLASFALAVFSGVFAFQVDAWRNYAWARELQARSEEEREQFRQERYAWKRALKQCGAALYVFFLLGIAAAALYIGARVVG